MARRGPRQPTPVAVERLAGRIAQWRLTRARRSAMPADLWSAATALAALHGVYRVARALRVNYDTLNRRVVETRVVGPTPPSGAAGFVELPTPGLGAVEAPRGAMVEVMDGVGARLVLRWSAEVAVDAAAIVSAFRRSGA